jgi:DME family drug/metabolite transporter
VTSRPTRAVAEVLAAAVLFGTTGTARALGAPAASSLGVGAARLLVGGLALVLIARIVGARLGAGTSWRLLLLAGALTAVYQLAFFAGLDRTGVAIGTVVTIGSGPPLAGAISVLAGQERPTLRWLVATVVAVCGIVLLASPWNDAVDPVGVALGLLSGLGYAGYTVVAKALITGGARPTAVMAGAFGIGGLLLVPAMLTTDPGWVVGGAGLATALYLGLVPTALAYVLFARGLLVLAAPVVTTLVLAEPVVAAVLGVLVLDEVLGPTAVIGCVLVLVGLVVLAGSYRVRSPHD